MDVQAAFQQFQQLSEADQTTRERIKELVRELDQIGRTVEATLQAVHHTRHDEVLVVVSQARSQFGSVKSIVQNLRSLFPESDYYKYNGHWRQSMQQLCFLAAFIVYLAEDRLITLNDLTDLFGVTVTEDHTFHIELDDFLSGLCSLSQELARLCTNYVTLGDMQRPLAISAFLSELHAGFRLLNLKNDHLRKRFDALKYDMKKVEGVVYDLSIRGLVPKKSDS